MSPRTLLALAAGIGLANVVLAFLVEGLFLRGRADALFFGLGSLSILVLVVLPFLLPGASLGCAACNGAASSEGLWRGRLGSALIVANVRVFAVFF